VLSQDVSKRREEGLPLLPEPSHAKNTRVDLSIYPPPATWYLRELKAWDSIHKPKKNIDALKSTENPIPVPADPIPIQPSGEVIALIPESPELGSSLTNLDSNTISEPVAMDTGLRTQNPLESGMPFAEPLPSSSRPLAEPPKTTPIEATPTEDSDNNQIKSPTDSTEDQSLGLPNSHTEPTPEEHESSPSNSEEHVPTFERSVSLSSEVAMEIDLRRRNSESEYSLIHCAHVLCH